MQNFLSSYDYYGDFQSTMLNFAQEPRFLELFFTTEFITFFAYTFVLMVILFAISMIGGYWIRFLLRALFFKT